jgi:hypothetical protein
LAGQGLQTLLDDLKKRAPVPDPEPALSPPMTLQCRVFPPVVWEKKGLERALSLVLPDELQNLWSIASEIRLMEDVNYGQWGCILWSPNEVIQRHLEATSWKRSEDLRPGDLVIGNFRGDPDLVILRCDSTQADYGSIVIALPMDERAEWPVVARSISEFIEEFASNPERKYWERRG